MPNYRDVVIINDVGLVLGVTRTAGVNDDSMIDLPDGILVDDVFGTVWDGTAFVSVVVDQEYRTRLRPGEVMSLLGATAYAKLHRAAYPQGAVEGDDMALYFLEQAKRPYSTDGMIEVTDPETVMALTYFRDHTPAYITQADMDRILQGVPV